MREEIIGDIGPQFLSIGCIKAVQHTVVGTGVQGLRAVVIVPVKIPVVDVPIKQIIARRRFADKGGAGVYDITQIVVISPPQGEPSRVISTPDIGDESIDLGRLFCAITIEIDIEVFANGGGIKIYLGI